MLMIQQWQAQTAFRLYYSNQHQLFEIMDLGELKFMLRILITHDCMKQLTYLNQSTYVHQILNYFNIKSAILVSTLLAIKHNLSASQSPNSEAEKQTYKNYSKGIHYLLLMGSFLFAIQTQPNIQFAVTFIAQFGANPGITYLEVAKCILHYLKGTIEFSLVLDKKTKNSFNLVRQTDSNQAQDLDDQ